MGGIAQLIDLTPALGPVWGPTAMAAAVVGLAAALLYGFVLAGRPPSIPRTVVKTLAVGGLLVYAAAWGAPWLLLAALAACVLGDAFLALDPKRWLPWGLFAFLLGHVLYIALFAGWREPGLEPGPVRMGAFVILAATAVALLAFLWKHLGALRPAVVLYVIVISVMTGSSFMLDPAYWPAMVGSVAFMLSDAVLAIGLFRGEMLMGSTRISNWTVWFFYCAAQLGIAAAFIPAY